MATWQPAVRSSLYFCKAIDHHWGEAVVPQRRQALRNADVATHLNRYLQGMADQARFIVIENHKSDQDVVTRYAIYPFIKYPSIGRANPFV